MKRLALVATLLVTGCAALGLGPAEHAEIIDTQADISRCEAEGFACKADAGPDAGCFASTYVPCMREAGLL